MVDDLLILESFNWSTGFDLVPVGEFVRAEAGHGQNLTPDRILSKA
jgi:hypothetical protein